MDAELEQTRKLVAEARAGSQGAYEALFGRYRDVLERSLEHAWARAGRRGLERSDLIQEALLDAVKGFENFEMRDEGAFRRWLGRILENRVRMALRGSRREMRDVAREMPLDPLVEASSRRSSPLAGSATSPSSGAAAHERQERIEAALEHLPPDHREVIRIVKLEQLSIADAAARMQRSENAVKKLLARALLGLRAALEAAGVEDHEP